MTIHIRVGDYLILNSLSSKPFLAKCCAASKDGKKYKAKAELKDDTAEPAFDFKQNEVVANLGSSPNAGSVYGVKVEPKRESLEHPFWGTISIHHPLDDESRKMLKKHLHETHTKLKAQNLSLPLEVEVRTQVGTMAGYYKYKPKADVDILCIKLDSDLSDLDYRLSHEFAHGIWYRCFSPKMKMAWVDMYHSAVAVNNYSDKDLKSLLDDIISNGDLRGFMKENPDDGQILRAIFRHIKQTHSIERGHFEMALMLEQDVSVYWPNAIELGAKQVLLTEYAQKSPEELWAEAFSLKFIGKKLPSKLDALLGKCLTRLIK